MWKQTRVTQALGLKVPIIQGPYGGGLSSTKLASTVANSGGLGSFGAHQLSPQAILDLASELRVLTKAPFALNLWVPLTGEREHQLSREAYDKATACLAPYYRELNVSPPALEALKPLDFDAQLAAILEARPPVFSFIFGIPPREHLRECRKLGIKLIGTVTNLEEAVAMDEAGVDVIVASGAEAGGHRASFIGAPEESPGVSALIPQVADRVKTPVVAAGGVADGRGIVAAFAYGAEGVQVGSAFLACDESNASAAHRAQLRKGLSTALTKAFSGRLARGMKNRFLLEMKAFEDELPPYPYQNLLTQPLRREAAKIGNADFLSLWSGQNAALIRETTAAALVEFLIADTERVLGVLAAL